MKEDLRDYETAAYLIEGLKLDLIQCVRLILELSERLRASRIKTKDDLVTLSRRVIQLGVQAVADEESSVSFRQAVKECINAKQHRSPRTIQDIELNLKRLLRDHPKLARRSLRGINAKDCHDWLRRSFHTPSSFRKARVNLSGVFTVGRKRGWCNENPIERVDAPHVEEKEIFPLTMEEITRLRKTAAIPRHQICEPALGLMLMAGVRPDEVRRLNWSSIDWDGKQVIIPMRHSKTGGGRYIAICPPLLSMLKRHRPNDIFEPICPRNWRDRWRQLRRDAGFVTWVPDVLRHTYASYFMKKHMNLSQLQVYMGHRDATLLLTRYVNLAGISPKDAQDFWTNC